jgi:autotransporter-associated beta strand protein
MKRSSLFTNVLFVLLLVAAGLAGTANAGALYWSGGDKTWDDGTTFNWSATPGGGSGPYTDANWIGGSAAHFEGTAGAVTVSGTINSVDSIYFDANDYTLTSGTIKLTGTGGNITTIAGTNTIDSIIDGSVGLTKAGTGILKLGGANIYTGLTTVSAGTLAYGDANAIPAGNDVTVDGATAILDIAGNNGTVGTVILDNGGSIAGTAGVLTGTTLDVRKGAISAILGGAGALDKSTADTVVLSGANTHSGVTTVTGGTLQYSLPGASTATGSIVINGGDITIDDDVSLAVDNGGATRLSSITFSTTNSINKTGTTGVITNNGTSGVDDQPVFTITVTPGQTGTIGADMTFAGNNNGQPGWVMGGGGNLTLTGQCKSIDGGTKNSIFWNGGGTLTIAAGGLFSNYYTGDNAQTNKIFIGDSSANNTVNVQGRLLGNALYMGLNGNGNNTLNVSGPGNSTTPTLQMTGSNNAFFVGNGSSNNTANFTSGSYTYMSKGSGAPLFIVGYQAGDTGNAVNIIGPGTIVNSYFEHMVGGAGDNNTVTVSAGGAWINHYRDWIGTTGDNNQVLVTGDGSRMETSLTNSNVKFMVGVQAGAEFNNLTVAAGGSATIAAGQANRENAIGLVTGADDNYIRVTGVGTNPSLLTITHYNPLAIGGTYTNGAANDSDAAGNHLDVYSGATADLRTVYLMGVDSAFNLGDGTGISTATVAKSTGSPSTGVVLSKADSRLNINSGKLIAGVAGAMVSGPGQIIIYGPAYIDTNGFDTSIDSYITGVGSLTKEGEGSLIIYGAHDYTGETIVQSGGTLGLEQVGLDDAAAVRIESEGATYGKMEIGFTGGDVVGELWLGGVKMTRPGAYNETNYPNYFVGTGGWLEITLSTVPGDTNNDGVVDAADYITVKQNFGMTGATLGAKQGDFDKDGTVEWDDLQTLMDNFVTRSIGGAPAAPEPATLGLLAIGALAVLRRRSCLRP